MPDLPPIFHVQVRNVLDQPARGPAFQDPARRIIVIRRDLPGISPELLDARQTAQLLNIGRNHVYELAHSGGLPCIRLGNRMRFPRTAILRWIDQQVQA